jgi:hypothetical protein
MRAQRTEEEREERNKERSKSREERDGLESERN